MKAFKSWFRSLLTLLILDYPIVLAALLSGVFILASPILKSELMWRAQLIMTATLAASLSGLILKFSRQPSIRVVKGSGDEAFLIEDGIKRSIPDSLTHDFVMQDTYCETERISDLELRLYPTGRPLPKLSSCELVKGTGSAIYVVWEGYRKNIPDNPTFKYFFRERKVNVRSDADLENIPRTGSLRTILVGTGAWLSMSLAEEDSRPPKSMAQKLLEELKRFES